MPVDLRGAKRVSGEMCEYLYLSLLELIEDEEA